MAITSSFYDTTPGNGITESEWARNRFGAPAYGVAGSNDWKVTAVAGQDRTVSIALGKGFGYGVADVSDANETRQLGIVAGANGTARWDLIAAHRDWQPAGGGPTSFTVIPGTSEQKIPAGRVHDPGVVDDQPLALVEVIAGQTGVGRIIDLRCWASNGGLTAIDDLARTYLNQPGTTVSIGERVWQYLPGTNGVFSWRSLMGLTSAHGPLSPSELYSNDGVIIVEGGRRNVAISINRTAPDLTVGTEFVSLGVVIPPAARVSTDRTFYKAGWFYGSANANYPCNYFVNMQTGQVLVRIQSGSVTFPGPVSFDIDLTAIE